jgi:hypothetical protein
MRTRKDYECYNIRMTVFDGPKKEKKEPVYTDMGNMSNCKANMALTDDNRELGLEAG